jgi:hypothetical protein
MVLRQSAGTESMLLKLDTLIVWADGFTIVHNMM